MVNPPLNKLSGKPGGHPSRARRVTIVAPGEGAGEYWAQCPDCRSIVHVPPGGAVTCACKRLFRWPAEGRK
jgi:hypothetical protein